MTGTFLQKSSCCCPLPLPLPLPSLPLPLPLPLGSLPSGGACLAPPGLGQLGLSWPTPLRLEQIAPPDPLAHCADVQSRLG